MKNDKRY